MHVGLRHVGQVVVDHQVELVNINTASGDIGGDQHLRGARLEVTQRPLARVLRLVSVDGRAADARPGQDPCNLVGTMLGAREDQHRLVLFLFQQVDQQILLFEFLHQVDALVDNVKETLSKHGYEPQRIEGVRSASWILMDYGDIVVHVFSKEDRLFYNLERIWRDGKTIPKEELER